MTFWNNEQQVQKITIHAWCLIFPCLQAKNPKILALTNLHFLLHVKKKFRKEYTKKNKKHQPNLFSRRLFASWRLAGCLFHSTLLFAARKLSGFHKTCHRAGGASLHMVLYGKMTCLLPWLPQRVGRGACQGPIYFSRLALPPKGRQTPP